MSNRGSASKRFSKLIRYFNFQQRTVVDPVTQEETIEEVPVLENVSLEASTDVTVSGQQVVTSANNSISAESLTIDTAEVTYNHSDSSLHVNGNALAFKSDIGNVAGDLTVSGGDIILDGTGRIQGIDTVSAGTDAANKTYVDAAVGNNAFPSGTKMLFQQTSAPTGWTKDTTHNNKALRVTSGTASSGGTSSFNTVFGKTATNNHTLTAAQMPSHTHNTNNTGAHSHNTSNAGAHSHNTNNTGNHRHSISVSYSSSGTNMIQYNNRAANQGTLWSQYAGNHTHNTNNTGGHTHNTNNTGGHSHNMNNAGSGGAHSHGMDIRVQYVDVIIATKN